MTKIQNSFRTVEFRIFNLFRISTNFIKSGVFRILCSLKITWLVGMASSRELGLNIL